MVLEVASRCLSVCPFPPSVVTLTSLLPTLSSALFLIHTSAISSLSLPSDTVEKTIDLGQLCCLLHLLPSWHPLFAISSRACVWQHAYLYACKLACTFLQACTSVSGCTCLHTSEPTHIIFVCILWSAEYKAAWENHGWSRVWVGPIIKNNPSICSASPVAGSAEKHGQKSESRKKNGVLTRRERKICLYNPRFALPTFCWLLVVRKWERARFSPPENNTNPSKLKSNTQSTSQETILKRKTSQRELHLNAAGMRCLARPPRLTLSPLPSLSRLQPQPNPNHTSSQTTRLPFSHSLSISPFSPSFPLLLFFASLSLSLWACSQQL